MSSLAHIQIDEQTLLTLDELRARLEAIGGERYHHKHPFHLTMHAGQLNATQLQAWAVNRYYYQSRIPIKDAIILSRSEDADFRRTWRQRIIDHDGDQVGPGGIEFWIRLAEATGAHREDVVACKHLLPGVRYAVDSYLSLVQHSTFVEAVASSLTEMFAGKLIALRMDALRKHYPWLSGALGYFENRVSQAPRDAEFAFDWVCLHAKTRQEQESAMNALRKKCDLLWAQLDAIHFAYVQPGWPPPALDVKGFK